MTQYWRHPQGKKNAQLTKRVAVLCRLLARGAPAADLEAAANEVRAGVVRLLHGTMSRGTPDHRAVRARAEEVAADTPCDVFVRGCSPFAARGTVPDVDEVLRWLDWRSILPGA